MLFVDFRNNRDRIVKTKIYETLTESLIDIFHKKHILNLWVYEFLYKICSLYKSIIVKI